MTDCVTEQTDLCDRDVKDAHRKNSIQYVMLKNMVLMNLKKNKSKVKRIPERCNQIGLRRKQKKVTRSSTSELYPQKYNFRHRQSLLR